MSLKLFVFSFVASLLMLSPVHADDDETGAAQEVAPSSPLEERIRAHRERFDQRELQREQRRTELELQHEQRRTEHERRREESRKRHEAMQKYYSEKMQARLTLIEQRQQQIASRHEAMRNRAQDRYNYLNGNSEDMLNKALNAQLDIANRHEEIRKQAEERHKRIAAHRDAMMGMTLQERRAYLDEHASEIFGQSAAIPRSSVPPRPPWMMQHPSSPSCGHVPRRPCPHHPGAQAKQSAN